MAHHDEPVRPAGDEPPGDPPLSRTSQPQELRPVPQVHGRPPGRPRTAWSLPPRQGPYLTGTAGSARLSGIDAARGLAVLGMIVAHLGATTCGLTSVAGLLSLAHGRSSVLFATVAGLSMGIMSGRQHPHRGEQLVRTRARLLARSALLLVLGGLVAMLATRVVVILGFYAAWLTLALPLLTWSSRRLLALAALAAAVGPVLVQVGPALMAAMGLYPAGAFDDGNSAVFSFFLTGHYPGAVWMAYILVGLGLSRLDLGLPRILWRLVGAGALCTALGYGGAAVLGPLVSPGGHDIIHVTSPSDPQACAAQAASRGLPATLVTAAPHSNTFFEVLGSGGTAVVVLALSLLVARRSRLVLAPLAAVGSMSLTVYCAHIAVIYAGRIPVASSNSTATWMCLAAAAFAMTWFTVFARGPLEHLVHVVSVRTATARE